MTEPIQNEHVVGQGLARLTSAYITKPNVRAWLAAILPGLQALENVFFDILGARLLRTAAVQAVPQTNVVFDVLAQLVGVGKRGLLSDLALKTFILLRIAINRSAGRTTDWARFAAILLPYTDGKVQYLDGYAAVGFGLWNLRLPPLRVAQALAQASANGVGGIFAYSTWPDGNDFMWGSRYSASAGQGKWGSRYSPSTGGVWVAGAAL